MTDGYALGPTIGAALPVAATLIATAVLRRKDRAPAAAPSPHTEMSALVRMGASR